MDMPQDVRHSQEREPVALLVKGLRASLGGREVVHDASFAVRAGELACLLGANGSGKTTTLRAILGLLEARGGDVLVDGHSTLGLSDLERARIFSYVPQAHAPTFAYEAKDVVMLGRTAHMKGHLGPTSEDERITQQAMERLGIGDLASQPYTQLSGGQRQLVLIARAIAQEPRVLVMDEPTASLDFGNQLLVLHELRSLADDGVTILVVTHDPSQAFGFADRAIVMEAGRTTASGYPAEVLDGKTLSRMYGTPLRVVSVRSGESALRVCVPDTEARRHGPVCSSGFASRD